MSQLVIFLEGTNKSGKSTLAKYITENSGKKFEMIKCSQPEIVNGRNTAFDHYMHILSRIEDNPEKNYIIDRFHFGSYVYGPIYRGRPDFGFNDFVHIEERIMKLNYLFIVAIASKKFIKEKFISDKEEFAKVELISEEVKKFEDTCRMSRLNLNYHKLPKQDLAKDGKILNMMSLYENNI